MRTPPHILVVDDQPMHVDILKTRLAVHGYAVLTATVYSVLRIHERAEAASTAYRKCRASLARGKALFFRAMRWKELHTYFRRAVLEAASIKIPYPSFLADHRLEFF